MKKIPNDYDICMAWREWWNVDDSRRFGQYVMCKFGLTEQDAPVLWEMRDPVTAFDMAIAIAKD